MITKTDGIISECAACGKGGDDLKRCTACKLVNYCSVSCQKVHRPKHKKECRKRAAEIFDEALFKQPPPKEDCPICFLPLPSMHETFYQSCCGKTLCNGCVYEITTETDICPFCRESAAVSDEESLARCNKRMEAGDAIAFHILGTHYSIGDWGLPQDSKKALKLMQRAIELGLTDAHLDIAGIYMHAAGLERDSKKVIYHYQHAAMGGNEIARNNLGVYETEAGNIKRAVKHWMIAAGAGDKDSLGNIRQWFLQGHVTKIEYEKTLRAYQKYLDDVTSDQRNKAAACER
mmetsp:Transcript_11318/g.20109  ORF Transcript_11318/g.20109 Transcript_11318/m.20109 type:complete len:290 (-) Transcript_11318:73-942(-)